MARQAQNKLGTLVIIVYFQVVCSYFCNRGHGMGKGGVNEINLHTLKISVVKSIYYKIIYICLSYLATGQCLSLQAKVLFILWIDDYIEGMMRDAMYNTYLIINHYIFTCYFMYYILICDYHY